MQFSPISPLYKTLQQISYTNQDFAFGRLDGARYESFVNAYTDGTGQPTFFVIDAVKQVYWFNATIGTDVEKVEAYLNAITKGEITATTAATSILHQIVNFVSAFYGDMLEDPLILVLVIALFIVIVIAAVWYISEPSGDANQTTAGATDANPAGSKQHTATVTIEKPESGDSNRPDKVKKD